MNFKPSEFFIGLVEFITILLPGALFAALLLLVEAKHPFSGAEPLYSFALNKDFSTVFYVAYIVAAFGLGYFLNSFASGLDLPFNSVRKRIKPYSSEITNKKESEEAYCNRPLSIFLQLFFELEYKVTVSTAFDETEKLRDAQHESVKRSSNVYKWATLMLETKFPAIAVEINKTMAASKFFRSLVIVFLTALVLRLFGYINFPIWLIIVLIVLSFREYVVQRMKCIEKTYLSVVVLWNTKA